LIDTSCRGKGGCLGADIDHRALGFQGEHSAVYDVTGLEVVVVLAQQRRELVEGEAHPVEIAAARAAARVVGGGHLFRNREVEIVNCRIGGQVEICLDAADIGRGHGHGRSAACQ
jgi:hypothetical protein